MKAIIAYIPVIHQGYIEFLQKNQVDMVYVLGKSITNQFRPLQKDIRALDPDQIVTSILALKLAPQAMVIEKQELAELKVSQLIMPDETISRSIAQKYFPQLTITFDNIFLRWDEAKSTSPQLVKADEIIKTEDLEFIKQAEQLKNKSADWWRQVGALIVKEGKVILSAFNQHLPSEQQPYIDGDPRADFHQGEQIDKSTALHAEASLIAQAARQGVSLSGSSLYLTTFPCPNCAKLIANSGIKDIYFNEGYSMVDGERVLKSSGVKIIQVKSKDE